MEGGWAVSKTKEHNERFEEASVHSKCSLPLVNFLDVNIVEPPSDVEFGEVLHFSEFHNELWDEWEWVLVLHGHGIQGMVVLYQMEFAILFLNKEDRRGHRGLQGAYLTRFKVFLEEGVELGLFRNGEQVDLAGLGVRIRGYSTA